MPLHHSRLGEKDLADLKDSLAAAGLPVSDLTEPGRLFYRFDDDAGLAGFSGLEGRGPDRLLRSVVVTPFRRGQGLGGSIVKATEAAAEADGVECLHLLTTTAAHFFRTCGYADADRKKAPASIAASREFTSLCPASATYLIKELG